MKKTLIFTLTALMIGSWNFSAAYASQKVAIIDIQAVVAKSAQVQALHKEQQTKLQELEKWIKTVQADIDKQQTTEGKEKLMKKYNSDFAKKQEVLSEDYKTKLQAIDKSISETIAAQAKAKGYDMVITKGAVVYGGDDITADVIKVVK